MRLIPYIPNHLGMLVPQPGQFDVQPTDVKYANELAASGPGFTGFVDGSVVFCAGRAEIWHNRYMVWAVLSENAGVHMVSITRAVKGLLNAARGDGRHEMIVRPDFAEANRWATMLGFKLHHFEERFLPDGGDANIYVRYL